MMPKKTYYLLSLGCAKNLVDSNSMARLLDDSGFVSVERPANAELLIVNTCGFIRPAVDESLDELRKLSKKKKKGQLLIATGCLTERYRQHVAEQVPGIDGILGTRRWMDIVDLVQQLRAEPQKPRYHLPETPAVGTDEQGVLRAAIQGANAYIKIADGCRRGCAFCAIPLIKGPQVSRPMDAILNDARTLQKMGIQELILISQDTTDYGSDLGMKDGLARLLEQLISAVPNIPWIRILYAYPGFVTDHLIDVMAKNRQVLPYLDIPLQHAHPDILKRMRRPSNMDWVYQTIAKMRTAMPELALRTTFIVGYPGETEKEFQTLLDFMQAMKFDHVGAFPFFFEKGTASEALGDDVQEEVKQERIERLMTLQQEISLVRNQSFVGKQLSVLIEGYNEGISVGRSYRDAPEIDGMVFVDDEMPLNQIIPVKISDALVHDLVGYPVK